MLRTVLLLIVSLVALALLNPKAMATEIHGVPVTVVDFYGTGFISNPTGVGEDTYITLQVRPTQAGAQYELLHCDADSAHFGWESVDNPRARMLSIDSYDDYHDFSFTHPVINFATPSSQTTDVSANFSDAAYWRLYFRGFLTYQYNSEVYGGEDTEPFDVTVAAISSIHYIDDRDNSNTNITNGSTEVSVGQLVTLYANIVPADLSPTWGIDGTVMKDYVFGHSNAHVVSLSDSDLNNATIAYYYVSGAGGDVTATLGSVTVTTTINVWRPTATFTSYYGATGDIAVDSNYAPHAGVYLHDGMATSAHDDHGIGFNGSATIPARYLRANIINQSLNLSNVQTWTIWNDVQQYLGPYGGYVWYRIVVPSGAGLDTDMPYPNWSRTDSIQANSDHLAGVHVADGPADPCINYAGQSGIPSDSPSTPSSTRMVKEDSDFTMFLLFTPAGAHSRPVPLSSINWHWFGWAKLNTGSSPAVWYKDSGSKTPATAPTSVDQTTPVTWSFNAADYFTVWTPE